MFGRKQYKARSLSILNHWKRGLERTPRRLSAEINRIRQFEKLLDVFGRNGGTERRDGFAKARL